MALKLFIASIATLQIIYVKGGHYTSHEDLSDGVITKYLKGKTKVSCVLQCERDEQCDEAMFRLNDKQRRSGECWFVKKISNNGKVDTGKFKQDKSIKSFKKLPICGKTPCYFGRCVQTDDSKQYKCESDDKWVLLKRNVCFGARVNQSGRFHVNYDGIVTGIKLQHVGGSGVTCSMLLTPTKWGCNATGVYPLEYIGVLITDIQENILYPSPKYHIGNGLFHIPGYNANSPYLIFNATNHTVNKGQELRLHYSEGIFGGAHDNSGESCADIFAILQV
ncbi:uncharacterized protein LOC130657256 [Hydractinia symbiolongicarpus]|uniref:uncharacterized protein LOC130657256 n=1 Tax=Hydractinia symbiolongicarpus TaxID=13093 RepID=UPI00254B5CE5|nr:uncharacterized protein LOC130657256 [Hydractinia symbiolongicarpus]